MPRDPLRSQTSSLVLTLYGAPTKEAFAAVQVAVRQVLQISNSHHYEVLGVWKPTLEKIMASHYQELGNSLYAILVVQACAIIVAEPILLLTSSVVEALMPFQNKLHHCRFLESAQAVFRAYWMAIRSAAYGTAEQSFRRIWNSVPWLGVASSLTPSTSPDFTIMSWISSMHKEMLCSNASVELGWRRPPPAYIDHFDVTIDYDHDAVSFPSILPPMSVFHPPKHMAYPPTHGLQMHEDVHLLLAARLQDDPDILPLMHLGHWRHLFNTTNLDALKKGRLLGGRAKRLLSLDTLLHWELRQSVEAYLGHVMQAIAHDTHRVPQFRVSDALRTLGIELTGAHDSEPYRASTEPDQHQTRGFRPDRLGITDRWGKYREFDERGEKLHAQWCHSSRSANGCPIYLSFDGCGCACPYMHARTADLARWLTENARDPATKPPTPWNRDVHPKDSTGRLLASGLPYIDGFCLTPTEYRKQNPSYVPPDKKRRLDAAREDITIDAFSSETSTQVQQTRDFAELSFAAMKRYW